MRRRRKRHTKKPEPEHSVIPREVAKHTKEPEPERSVIPREVAHILKHLNAAGYEAWCVGGCVRDILLGKTPQDWDVTTSAKPEEVQAVFPRRTIPTGLRHGTVTVRSGPSGGVEVTTYRLDGPYLDHRRPSSVCFTTDLEEDLRRRDFTVNAMAMGRDETLRDPFGGQADLHAGILRCVGEADARFSEDALRIMRGLRFASTLGLSIEAETAAGIRRNRELLREIAAERIQVELFKLLCGRQAAEVLRQFPEVIGTFWPEILEMVGFEQKNPHHCYDVWEHTLHALEAVEAENLLLRCTMLLHDIGKPRTFSLDAAGTGHFYGHAALGRDLAEQMLRRVRCPNAFRERVVRLVEWHDREILNTEKSVRKALGKLGEEDFRLLLAVKRADNLAQSPAYRSRQSELDELEKTLQEIIAQGACFTLRQMKVNGNDMKQLGLTGREIGAALHYLLDAVIDGKIPNQPRPLMRAARQWIREEERKNFPVLPPE